MSTKPKWKWVYNKPKNCRICSKPYDYMVEFYDEGWTYHVCPSCVSLLHLAHVNFDESKIE